MNSSVVAPRTFLYRCTAFCCMKRWEWRSNAFAWHKNRLLSAKAKPRDTRGVACLSFAAGSGLKDFVSLYLVAACLLA